MAVNTWIAGTTTGTQMATEFNKVANALNTIGQYSHNATVALTTTATAVPFAVNDAQAGSISHSTSTNTTRFIATSDGDFIFVIQPQIEHLTTGTGSCTFWLRKNGTTPISNSAAIFKMGAVAGTGVLVIECAVPLVLNDYIEVMTVASAASEHQITYTVGSGSGATAVPNTPSIIATITQLPL